MSAYRLGNAPNLYNADGSPAGQMGLDGVEYPSSVSGAGNFVFDTTAVSGAANTTEQILKQYVIPADAITASHYVRLSFLVSKSGTTEAMTLRFRIGSTGTTADAQLAAQTAPNAASRSNAAEIYFFAASPTQIRHLGSTPFAGMVGGNSAVIPPVDVTVPDMSANALFLSVTAQMATGVETPTVNHVVMEFK